MNLKTLFLLTLICLSALTAAERSDNRRMGINLVDPDLERPFLDLAFSNLEGWRGGLNDGWGYMAQMSSQGFIFNNDLYPTFIPATGVARMRLQPKGAAGGRYIITWLGTATVNVAGTSGTSATGRLEVVLNQFYPGGDFVGGNIWVEVRNVNAADPMHALRMCRSEDEAAMNAAYAAGQIPWAPDFLARMTGYNTVRTMSFMGINNGSMVTWSERPRPGQACWPDIGWPLEVIADLCNRTKVNPWINIVHTANDDYVRQAARLMRDQLDPTLHVYLEHSNEVWNGMFAQSGYAQTRYASDLQATYGTSGSSFGDGLRWHAYRSQQIWQMWSEEFGGHDRLVRILGSWSAVTWASESMLDFLNQLGAVHSCDAIAIAPYFAAWIAYDDTSTPTPTQLDSWSMDTLFSNVSTDLSGHTTTILRDNHTSIQAKNAAYGTSVRLICYEGGPHILGPFSGATVVTSDPGAGGSLADRCTWKICQASIDPRMGTALGTYLDLWNSETGGDLFCYFCSYSTRSKYGCFGLADYIGDNAPKLQALTTWNAANTLPNNLAFSGAVPTTATAGVALTLPLSIVDDQAQKGMAVLCQWTASGPGTAAFADATHASTTVTFPVAGSYVLTCTADDGFRRTASTTTIVAGPGGPDTTPPVISAIASGTITAVAANITWSTDEAADTQVDYGTTTAYGSSSPLLAALVTSHSQVIVGLSASTVYHYRVRSRDAAGNLSTSADLTFTTAAPPDTTPPVITTPASGPASVSGTTATLSVSATDNSGDAGLTYSWGLASWSGSGAADVFYSANASHAASTTVATFAHAGTYRFTVMVSDAVYNTVASTTGDVVVAQTPTTLAIAETSPTVVSAGSVTLHATLGDQFGAAIASAPLEWSVDAGGSGGTITAGGVFTAPATSAPTSSIVHVSSGALSATVTVQVTAGGGHGGGGNPPGSSGSGCGFGSGAGLMSVFLVGIALRPRRRR